MLLQTQSTWNEKSVRNILFWCSITNIKIILVIKKKYSLKLTFQTQDLVVLICNYLCRKSVLFQDLKPHRDLLFHWYPWDEGRLPLSRKRVQERVMDRLMEAPIRVPNILRWVSALHIFYCSILQQPTHLHYLKHSKLWIKSHDGMIIDVFWQR